MKIDLYLIRHGETENNKRGILAGRLNMPLAKTGISQLEKLAVQHPYPQPEVVYRGPLDRCLDTAKIVFLRTVSQGDVRVEDALTEMDFGYFEGKPVRDFVDTEYYPGWKAKEPDFRFPGGETFREVNNRIEFALDRIIRDCENEGLVSVGAVSHNMVIVELMRNYLDVDVKEEGRMCPNGMGFHLRIDTDIWRAQKKVSYMGPLPIGADRPKASESPYVKAGK